MELIEHGTLDGHLRELPNDVGPIAVVQPRS